MRAPAAQRAPSGPWRSLPWRRTVIPPRRPRCTSSPFDVPSPPVSSPSSSPPRPGARRTSVGPPPAPPPPAASATRTSTSTSRIGSPPTTCTRSCRIPTRTRRRAPSWRRSRSEDRQEAQHRHLPAGRRRLDGPRLQRRRRRGRQRHAGDGRPGPGRAACSPRPTRRRPARPPAPPSTPARIRSTTASCARPCTARPAGSTAPSRCPSSSSSRATSPRASASGTSGENEGSLPQNVGYDDYRGFLGVSDMYTEWRDVYFNPEVALSPERFAMMERSPFDHDEVHCTPKDRKGCENRRLIDLDVIKKLDTDWVAHGVDFIGARRAPGSPSSSTTARAAATSTTTRPTSGRAGPCARTSYGDCMVQMDDVVRQIVGALEETGEIENTLVLLTSDNGPECEIPPHGRTPFRGCKGSSWEGGVRVPTFVYWKGMIQPAQVGRVVRSRRPAADRPVAGWRPGRDAGRTVPEDRPTSTASTRPRSWSPTTVCRRAAAAPTRSTSTSRPSASTSSRTS